MLCAWAPAFLSTLSLWFVLSFGFHILLLISARHLSLHLVVLAACLCDYVFVLFR